MSNTKHTPGPWKCYPINSMTCNNNRTFEIHGFETKQSVRDVLPTEVEANAKLIAAAPEMYAMLVEFANQTQPDVKKFQQHCLDLLTRIS